jgi:hypothetical protein
MILCGLIEKYKLKHFIGNINFSLLNNHNFFSKKNSDHIIFHLNQEKLSIKNI